MSDVNGPTGQTPASNGPEDAAVGTAGAGAEAATGSAAGSAAESVAGVGAPTGATAVGPHTTAAAGGRRVRVVLVDDHRMFRTGVQAEIGETERTGVEVVGEAADVDQAVTVITATRPEVVLLDVHLPGGGGVEVLRRCAR